MSESNQAPTTAADPAPQQWDSKTYELLSFQLTSEFVAVFAEMAGDGLVDLYSHPIQAIGLAKLTTKYYARRSGGSAVECRPAQTYNALVGLQLNDGYWHIVQECENFAGIAGVHADISEATGELDWMKYGKLRCKQG